MIKAKKSINNVSAHSGKQDCHMENKTFNSYNVIESNFGNVIYVIAINCVNLITQGIFVFACVSHFELQHFTVFWAVSVPVAFSMVVLNHLTKHVFKLSLL